MIMVGWPLMYWSGNDMEKYIAVIDNAIVFTIERGESISKWIVKSMTGQILEQPEQMRHDLFELLKLKYNCNIYEMEEV